MYYKTFKKPFLKPILVAKVLYGYDIFIFSFENNQKKNFVKIEVCGKNVRFLKISEYTKENLIHFPVVLFLLSFLGI